MENDTAIEVVRLYRFGADSKTKAFVDIAVGNYVVRGLKVIEGKKGLFLGLPQEKSKDGKWYNSFYPRTKEARENLVETVLAAYRL